MCCGGKIEVKVRKDNLLHSVKYPAKCCWFSFCYLQNFLRVLCVQDFEIWWGIYVTIGDCNGTFFAIQELVALEAFTMKSLLILLICIFS